MSFANYVTGGALLGKGWACFESNRTQALLGNVVLSGLVVSQRGAGANMSVDVATGSYLWLGATTTKVAVTNVVISAADGSNPRYDVIYANSGGTIGVTSGTAASAPVVPDLAASSIALAVVAVAAGAANIVNANITDLRVLRQPFVAADIASDAVITAKILNANVTAEKLATDAVETIKIKDANVTTGKLAANAVDSTKLYAGAWLGTLITSGALAAPAASIDISSIASGYKRLLFEMLAGTESGNTHAIFTLNNDSASGHYAYHVSSAYSTTISNGDSPISTGIKSSVVSTLSTTIDACYEALFFNRTDAYRKSYLIRSGSSAPVVNEVGGAWTNATDEINRITVSLESGNFGVGTTYRLVGFK